MDYIKASTLLSKYTKDNPWFGIDYNMNIYKGCCHGCIYCDSRSECYGIEDFHKVRAKENSTIIIRNELKRKTKKGVIGTGSMSDPYNPLEEKYMLTRRALEQINTYNFGVALATKSSLIERDIDLFKKIKVHSPVLAKVTITTSDDLLCEKLEPKVCNTSKRFKTIEKLCENGIFTGVLLMPILPFINDNEENIKIIVKRASNSGAKFIFSFGMGVTLRKKQREYFYRELIRLFPNKNLVTKYNEIFKNDYECPSPNHKKLWYVLKNECEKVGLLYKMDDIIKEYKDVYNGQIKWF